MPEITMSEAVEAGEPIYTLPPNELQPEMSIRADMLQEQRDWSHAQLGIPELHARGILGEGVLIAILDTGISIDHKDLKANIAPSGHKDFTGSHSLFSFVLLLPRQDFPQQRRIFRRQHLPSGRLTQHGQFPLHPPRAPLRRAGKAQGHEEANQLPVGQGCHVIAPRKNATTETTTARPPP